jgi:hypothetical protein
MRMHGLFYENKPKASDELNGILIKPFSVAELARTAVIPKLPATLPI